MLRIGDLVGPTPTDEILVYDAMLLALGEMAESTGLDRAEFEQQSMARIVLETEHATSGSFLRRVNQRYAHRPGVQARVAAERQTRSAIIEKVERLRQARRRPDRDAPSLAVLTLDDAAASVIDIGTIDTLEHPAVVGLTTTAVATYSASLNSASVDTLELVEEITDSSRVFWEEFALATWIDADGDTTIFIPQYSAGGCRIGTRESSPPAAPELPRVVACQPCIRAAAAGVTTDAVVGFVAARGGQTGWQLAGTTAGASLISGIGARYGEVVVGGTSNAIGRAYNWLRSFGG